MTLQDLGSLSLAALNPSLISLNAGLSATASAILPGLTALVTGILTAQAQLILFPPSISVMLADAIAAVASITLAISVGVPPVDIQLVAIASGIVEISASIGTFEAQAALLASLPINASVVGYLYEGEVSGLGAAMRAATANGIQAGTGGTPANALVLAATSPASVGALVDLYGLGTVNPGLTVLGEKTLISFNEALASVFAELKLNIDGQLPGLYAQIDGMLDAQASLLLSPPSLLGQLAFAGQLVALLPTLALTLPSASAQLDALGSALVQLQGLVAELNAQISLTVELGTTLANSAVQAYFFDGAARDFGSELSAATGSGIGGGGPSDPVTAFVLATDSPVSASALSTLYGVAA